LSDRPNVVWIVLDTARADAFEPYGAAAGASPAIADLARRGSAQADVRATASWTLPSHMSMFAGRLPRALGLADQAGISPVTARPIVEAQRERWLPELLRRAGYATAGVSANAWITEHSGFAGGFDTFADVRSGRQAKMAAATRGDKARWMLEAVRARVDDGAADAEREMTRWAGALDGRPFLWFVNLVECHSPYLPPRPWAELGAVGRMRAALEAGEYLTLEAFWRTCVTGAVPPAEALERMRAGYRGAIRYMDAWLERLLGRLDAAGVLDDTLVVVTSDHGENFGEGRLIGHGFSLDERLINIPFVAAGPGAEQLQGIRSLAELPGRLAAIAGLEGHPYDAADLPPLPVAQYDSPAPPRGDERTEGAIALWDLDEHAALMLTMALTSAVDGDLKLVVREGHEAFYDLRADPLEAAPLAAEAVDAAACDRLRQALAHPAVTESHARLSTHTPAAGTDTDDLEERMRLLGYL
jgi:arylsulfatase A-like enzyme